MVSIVEQQEKNSGNFPTFEGERDKIIITPISIATVAADNEAPPSVISDEDKC